METLKKNKISVLLIFMISILGSCSKSDDNGNYCDITKAAQAYNDAARAYSENLSIANCNAWKKAYQNLVDRAQKCTNIEPSIKYLIEVNEHVQSFNCDDLK